MMMMVKVMLISEDADHVLITVDYEKPDDDDFGDDDRDGDDGEDDDDAEDDGDYHLFTSALTSRSITSRTDSSPLEIMMMAMVIMMIRIKIIMIVMFMIMIMVMIMIKRKL